MTRLTIVLDDPEKKALRALAAVEYREPQAQAAFIIRQELARRGLIQPPTLPPATDPKPAEKETARD